VAVVLSLVKTAIEPERETEYNRWYNEEHCPMMLRFPGAVSARRFRAIRGDDGIYKMLAVYEYQDSATYERFERSDHARAMYEERRRAFGADVLPARSEAYVQLWP
jgi:antibiotic biosynthesis monooxygenase (ABM) superfamily enzyme